MSAGVLMVLAAGVSSYLPAYLDGAFERDIARVMLLADRALLTRPIAVDDIADALNVACDKDAALCASVRRRLARYDARFAVTTATLAAFDASDRPYRLPNQSGLTSDSPWLAAARTQLRLGEHLQLNLGGLAYDGGSDLAGSLLSAGWDFAQLDVGFREHWLSPFADSAMLFSSHAPTMPSVTLSNRRRLTRLGLRYEAFLADMGYSQQIAFEGGDTAGRPRLAGLHVSIEPVRGWAIGASRLLQFGGGARGGQSFGDILRAFFNPSKFDNAASPASLDNQFGNQLASISSRFVFPGAVPWSVYFEYAGEDTSFAKNFLLGNSALSVGIDVPRLWGQFDFTYEASEWQNGWYVNGLYGDGLTNDGQVIGHWGGDLRRFGDAIGAQTHMLRFGWWPSFGGRLELRYRTLANEDYGSAGYQRANQYALSYARNFGEFQLGAEVLAGEDVFANHYRHAGLTLNWHPGAGPADRASFSSSREHGAEWFLAAGASVANTRVDLADDVPTVTTGREYTPYLALGARRAIGPRSDIGTRMEFDRIDDHWLIGVRLLDYRRRIGPALALGGFVGAARYDLATPAYGIYVGAGTEWIDIMPGWNLGFDLRFAYKVARDHLLPEDPQSTRPDSFYDIGIAGLTLSRRF